jgi:predicted Holliday junction resolvase-like endonuclease
MLSNGVMWLAIAVLVAGIGLIWRDRRRVSQARDEYKELFEIGATEYKTANDKIQELLIASTEKEVTMSKASQSLGLAGQKITEQEALLSALDEKLRFQEAQYKKLIGQKKSSEVRTGKIAEQIAPFLEDYPKNPRTARFIGDPIDFVHFDEEMVTFVEVKSGKSQLSKKQRNIRDLIKDGKVEFLMYRIKGEDSPEKDDTDGNNGTG